MKRLIFRHQIIGLLLICFLFISCFYNTASADCTGTPDKLNVIDQANASTEAPVVFENNTFTLNTPSYCAPVDIYFAVVTSTGKLIFVDSANNLTLDFDPYAAGSTSAINTSFSVADSPLASDITGECVLYWLIAPANGGDIVQSLYGGFDLGFYVFENNEDEFTNSFGMTFIKINPGTFTMGFPESELSIHIYETYHQVTLTQAYYMQTTEVTQGQWQAVMGSNPSYFTACGSNCPVEGVSWDDVQSFISVLNQKGEGTYRLPTEAQWEYAARAGSTSAFANGGITGTGLNCGHDANLSAMGWYCGNSGVSYPGCYDASDWAGGGSSCAGTHPVAQKQSNAWGLYDMHGNVNEWCQDWYGEYPSSAVTDPGGPSSGSYRVLRGGCWYDGAWYCRSAHRLSGSTGLRYDGLGFRLVLSPGQ